MELISLALIKALDSMISTAKNITTYQNKKILTSILVIISQFIFYGVIKSVVSDNSVYSTIVVSIASGIGTYIIMLVSDKTKKDLTFTNILTCSKSEPIDALRDFLSEHKIKHIVIDSYNTQKEDNLTVLVFATTRHESKLIDMFVHESGTKFLRQVLH